MFIDKNINLTLKSLFATQMTMFILCRVSCRYSDIFAKVGFRVGKLSYLRLSFSEMNISLCLLIKILILRFYWLQLICMFNINLTLKSLFATQMTMFILCRISNHVVLNLDCSFCDEFATWDNFIALATSA